MSNTIGGSIKVGWQIAERGLGIADIQRELTREELTKLYDRIEELLASAFHQSMKIWIDGEDKPGVDVFLEAPYMGDCDIEIDDGPVNGSLEQLRRELESDGEETAS